MDGGPIEFNFGRELNEHNRAEQMTPTIATIQTTVTMPATAPTAPVAPRAAQPPAPKAVAPPTPKDIVQLARDRLKDVKADLVRMKALVKEHDELERLIAAAEGPPKTKPKSKASAKTSTPK